MLNGTGRRLLAPAVLATGLSWLMAGCVVPYPKADARGSAGPRSRARVEPDLPVAGAPFDDLEAGWKQRIAQAYLYLEHRGSYTGTGALIPTLQAAMVREGVEPAGAPFALYYDDPGKVPVSKLRSRACIPVSGPPVAWDGVRQDVLPSTTVVYAFVGGPYPEVPRAYPRLYAYLERMNWVENGPVVERYLVAPGEVSSFAELVTEVQIPATQRP